MSSFVPKSQFSRDAAATSITLTTSAKKSRPLPNSYWATPFLLATEYPWCPSMAQAPKLDCLISSGVRTFIDLTEDGELQSYAPHLPKRAALQNLDPSLLEYHQFPIRDRSLPESLELLSAILDVLRDNEGRGRITAVHCRGGIGRTGMVVGCWLVEGGIAQDGNEALSYIAREWQTVQKADRYPHSPETGAQHEYVMNYRRPKRTDSLRAC